MTTAPSLAVDSLRKTFPVDHGEIIAVDSISFSVRPGETLAVVGESGSGKSTLARCIVRMTDPDTGRIVVAGNDIGPAAPRRSAREAYADIQMVFQDPHASLNPRMKIGAILDEPLRLHTHLNAAERRERVADLLRLVELPESIAHRLPRALSGGQRQRIGIARAIAVEPKVIILDEPTASLDVSTRRQILDLLSDLQNRTGMAYLLISHDLEAVQYMADRVMVMYLGRVVEEGPADAVLKDPRHPYTKALRDASPVAALTQPVREVRLTGETPKLIGDRKGCVLAGRCPMTQASCTEATPMLLTVASGHRAACHVINP
ncbi:oligopeptide/dipeptide ABC transporter ATP-binding protein [Arthrobacter sp. 31Y]|uniref:oligopeptide/dipeptide ABC transporter ATP-binding protein n=1 Tax=Arthrobacter sp. 31Y TaxID=1115632 RepID=UPI000466D637|nr:oligopeptide/dipeptide ABC transporter ATP-binding protein [Arthrobacter sp. 31Y]